MSKLWAALLLLCLIAPTPAQADGVPGPYNYLVHGALPTDLDVVNEIALCTAEACVPTETDGRKSGRFSLAAPAGDYMVYVEYATRGQQVTGYLQVAEFDRWTVVQDAVTATPVSVAEDEDGTNLGTFQVQLPGEEPRFHSVSGQVVGGRHWTVDEVLLCSSMCMRRTRDGVTFGVGADGELLRMDERHPDTKGYHAEVAPDGSFALPAGSVVQGDYRVLVLLTGRDGEPDLGYLRADPRHPGMVKPVIGYREAEVFSVTDDVELPAVQLVQPPLPYATAALRTDDSAYALNDELLVVPLRAVRMRRDALIVVRLHGCAGKVVRTVRRRSNGRFDLSAPTSALGPDWHVSYVISQRGRRTVRGRIDYRNDRPWRCG